MRCPAWQDYIGTIEICEGVETRWVYYKVDGDLGEWFENTEVGAVEVANPIPYEELAYPNRNSPIDFTYLPATTHEIEIGVYTPSGTQPAVNVRSSFAYGIVVEESEYSPFESESFTVTPLGSGLFAITFTIACLFDGYTNYQRRHRVEVGTLAPLDVLSVVGMY